MTATDVRIDTDAEQVVPLASIFVLGDLAILPRDLQLLEQSDGLFG